MTAAFFAWKTHISVTFGSLENPNSSNKHVTSVLLEHGTLIRWVNFEQEHQTFCEESNLHETEVVPENRPKLPPKRKFHVPTFTFQGQRLSFKEGMTCELLFNEKFSSINSWQFQMVGH